MTFDEHFKKVTATSLALNIAIQDAATAGISVRVEGEQFPGYWLPKITMSLPVPNGKPSLPKR